MSEEFKRLWAGLDNEHKEMLRAIIARLAEEFSEV